MAKQYGVSNVRIFGSFARGEQRKNSDIDLHIDMPKRMSLLDLCGLKIDLEDALHRKVDVVPDDSIKPLLRDRILAEARPL
jgi:predicted nucleotidyltransferase